MRRIVLIASLAFCAALAAIWVASWQAEQPALKSRSAPSFSDPLTRFTAAEIAEHGMAESCWLVIEGRVYDVTTYLERHPADPTTILNYCGKDATQAFADKGVGRPHSSHARRLLAEYLMGTRAPD